MAGESSGYFGRAVRLVGLLSKSVLRVGDGGAVMPSVGTKSREVIWGSQIRDAKMSAESARQRATEAVREADRTEAYALVGPDGGLWRAGTAVAYHRGNAPTADWAGSRSSATAVRPEQVCRSAPSAGTNECIRTRSGERA